MAALTIGRLGGAMEKGFILFWRKAFDSGLHRDHRTWVLWTWILAHASHKKHTIVVGRQSVELLPGQLVVGRKALSRELNMSEQNVRSSLTVLEKLQNLTICPTNKFSVLTIVNWELYQPTPEKLTSKPTRWSTSTQPAVNQHPTTNNNGNNGDNGNTQKPSCAPKAHEVDSDFETFWKAYPRKVGKAACLKKWKQMNGSKPPMVKLMASLEAQKKTPQWTRDGGQYIPHPTTWLTQGRWDDEPVDPLVPKITRRPLNFRDAM